MSALFAHIEPSDKLDSVWLRTSATPNPERKPPIIVRRDELHDVMLMLLDAAKTEAETC